MAANPPWIHNNWLPTHPACTRSADRIRCSGGELLSTSRHCRLAWPLDRLLVLSLLMCIAGYTHNAHPNFQSHVIQVTEPVFAQTAVCPHPRRSTTSTTPRRQATLPRRTLSRRLVQTAFLPPPVKWQPSHPLVQHRRFTVTVLRNVEL